MHLRLIKRRLIKYKYVPHMLKTLQAVYQYSKSPPTYLVVQHKTNRAVRFTSLKSTQLWTMDSGMSLSSQAPHRYHPFKTSANFHEFWSLTPSVRSFLTINYFPTGNLANFWPLPPKKCRRRKWMVPQPNATAQTRDYASFQIVTNQRNDLTLATNLSNPSINAQWDI